MRYFTLLLLFSISFSTLAVSKRFIRSIDNIELKFNKDQAWRGNSATINLDVILSDGTTHSCANSSKINLKDFDFQFFGNGKIVKVKKRTVIVEFSKELKEEDSFISATLKRDPSHSYTYKVSVKDYRKEVSTIEIISNSNKIHPNSKFFINVKSFLSSHVTTTGESSPKVYQDDFNYAVSGCGKLISENGMVKIDEGYNPTNNEITITATLKSNPSISYTKTYKKHFNMIYWMYFEGSSGSNGRDGSCVRGQHGNDGRDHDSRYLDGEKGENGRNGEHGYHGQEGRNGENVNIYLQVLDNNPDNIVLKAETIDESGIKHTKYLGTSGEVRVDISGGNGGHGGDGYDGGRGGDGGNGSDRKTEKEDLRGYGGNAGNGGHGGWGGNGGRGGNGGYATIFYTEDAAPYINNIIVISNGGNGGRAGDGGDGGRAGNAGRGGLGNGQDGNRGQNGRDGERGQDGSSGYTQFVVWK